jgi:hypothetical protein
MTTGNRPFIGRRALALWLSILILLVFSLSAQAQELDPKKDVYNKNIHYFQPPSDGSGLLTTWGSEPIGHLGIHIGSFVDYAYRPMVYSDPQGVEHVVIYNQTGLNVLAGFGLWDALNVSMSYASTPSRSFNSRYLEIYEWKENAVEDMRVAVKYMFANRRIDGFGIAVMTEFTMDNGDAQNFVSDEQVTLAPRLILDFGNEGFTYAINLGYKIFPDGIEPGLFDIESGDELLINTGLTFRMFWGLEIFGEYAARAYTGESDYSSIYSELFGGIRSTWFLDNPLRLTIGASSGLTDGVGTPISRFYGGFNWHFRMLGWL